MESAFGLQENPSDSLFEELALAHDPEKWEPVFRKDHAQIRGSQGLIQLC
jgi:hypothetical protein